MKSDTLSNAELDVLAILWKRGSATVAEVRNELNGSNLDGKKFAYTTVGTHLSRMVEKGAVVSRKIGRSHVFKATEDRSEFRSDRLSTMVRQFFDNRPSSLASQFIEANSFTPEELDELRRLIDKKSTE